MPARRSTPPLAFHRFAPRPFAYADPRSASQLPPFTRARRFLEHVSGFDAAAFAALYRGAGVAASAFADAERQLGGMFVTPARVAARDALLQEARRVCDHAIEGERLRPVHANDVRRSVALAALALVLRDLLPPELFQLAYRAYAGVDAPQVPHPATIEDGTRPESVPDVVGAAVTEATDAEPTPAGLVHH